jgi:hypothetical protein
MSLNRAISDCKAEAQLPEAKKVAQRVALFFSWIDSAFFSY